ncbi:MAG: site-2 protease family protein [Candidatus Obscuribacter phosphatis]|uniref:Site-2 protease family protein n=1 Tax=Candidatus Obscuribacter phosphatis TaxID=1906157 RepID=A0A8J7PBM3_9BACT|nr:site-2 protease family protein [Candidatus Obscuribacter phosphatis]
MFEQALGIFLMLAILSVLIVVHECGHFLVARLFGFQTPVFGVGLPFGPYISLGRKWNTEFRIYAFLLGGFVAIPELGDETNASSSSEAFGVELNPFKKFPIWQRALVAVAGVTFNAIFAYFLMVVMFFSVGRQVEQTYVSALDPSNPIAKQAGVLAGDDIVALDKHPVTSTHEVIAYLGNRKSTPVTLSLIRDGKPLDLVMTTSPKGKVGMVLGQKPAQYIKIDAGPVETLGLAGSELVDRTRLMVVGLAEMVQALTPDFGPAQPGAPPKPGFKNLHGVLAVVKIGAGMVQIDWRSMFMFTIMISMDLAIINLLPWPALDGGHLAFMLVEAIRGKPIEERAHGEMVKWGFLSLIALMVLVMVNDVSALMNGELDIKPEMKEKLKGR